MFSLRFSGSKFVINLRQQFRARKIFRTKVLRDLQFLIMCLKFCTISKMRNLYRGLLFYENLLTDRLLTSAFALANGIVFSGSNGLAIQCLIACFD